MMCAWQGDRQSATVGTGKGYTVGMALNPKQQDELLVCAGDKPPGTAATRSTTKFLLEADREALRSKQRQETQSPIDAFTLISHVLAKSGACKQLLERRAPSLSAFSWHSAVGILLYTRDRPVLG